jgi:hypothetical protein
MTKLLLPALAGFLLAASRLCGAVQPSGIHNHTYGIEMADHTVVLTLDDGPGPMTVPIGYYLYTKGIQATFFEEGCRYSRDLAPDPAPPAKPGDIGSCDNDTNYNRSVLYALNSYGHILGNHTQNHILMNTGATDYCGNPYSNTQRIAEVLGWGSNLQYLLPAHHRYYRSPGFSWDAETAALLNSAWDPVDRTYSIYERYRGPISADIGDFYVGNGENGDVGCWNKNNDLSVSACAQMFIDDIVNNGNRGIIIFHDRPVTAPDGKSEYALIQQIVTWLEENDFRIVSLDSLPIPQ